MKIYRKILLTAIAAAMTFQTTAMAWTAQKQDLTQVEIVIDENVELSGNVPSDWAMQSIGELAENGIMNGTSDTTASPKDSCTVEQSILLIYRVYNSAI